jgi:hypothetical protein
VICCSESCNFTNFMCIKIWQNVIYLTFKFKICKYFVYCTFAAIVILWQPLQIKIDRMLFVSNCLQVTFFWTSWIIHILLKLQSSIMLLFLSHFVSIPLKHVFVHKLIKELWQFCFFVIDNISPKINNMGFNVNI